MFMKSVAITAIALTIPLAAPAAADAAQNICAEAATVYSFSSATVSSRPSNVKSAYITGPGTLVYSKSISATVGMTASSSVSAEAGVVVAKASAQLGVALSASRSWSDAFSYSLAVPRGQRRAMQLFQQSRSFYVTKKQLTSPCTYRTVYSGQPANAPRTKREDEWKLVS